MRNRTKHKMMPLLSPFMTCVLHSYISLVHQNVALCGNRLVTVVKSQGCVVKDEDLYVVIVSLMFFYSKRRKKRKKKRQPFRITGKRKRIITTNFTVKRLKKDNLS